MKGHPVGSPASAPPPRSPSHRSSASPWSTCLDVHFHPSESTLHRPSPLLPRLSSASSASSSSSGFSPSSPPSSSPLTASNLLSLSTLSTPTGSPVSAGPLSPSPFFRPVSSLPPRPWEGRVFSAQWKAVPVRVAFVHAFTVWESVNLVLCAERLQMESLYNRRVVLSLRFDELRRCGRDLSKAYKGKRARIVLANADRQWTLDLFEEAEAVAFNDLLTRALATLAANCRLRQASTSDSLDMAGQTGTAEEEPHLTRTGELSGSVSEEADTVDSDASDTESSVEHSTAVALLQQRLLSSLSPSVQLRVEEGNPLSTLLQLFGAVSPFESDPFDSELLDYRRPLSFAAISSSSPSQPSTPVSASNPRCADDPCNLLAEPGSMYCGRHCWRDEVTNAGALHEDDEDALTELRFSFPSANALAAQLLHAEFELRDALQLLLDECYHLLLQQPAGAVPDQVSLSREELRSIFAPFVRCHALSVSLGRDLQRLATHSALLPFLCRTLLQHLPDIRTVYGASFRFSDSIDRIRSRMDSRGPEDGVTLRQWREQRQSELAQADLLQLMGLPLQHMATYLRLLKAIEAQLPAKEKKVATDDTPLAPPRLRRLQRELDEVWQELLAISRANDVAQRREVERRRMEETSERFHPQLPFPLVSEGRRFIREDEVRLQGSEDGHLLLFTDVLLFALPEGPKRGTAALALRRTSSIRDGSGSSLGRWSAAAYWPLSELRATWWPSQAEAAEGYRRSVTLHTATGQVEVLFLDTPAKGDGDRRSRAGEARDSWCAAWRERARAPIREAASASVVASAQLCLDERRLSSGEFVQGIQPGLRRLCEEAVLDLFRTSSPASLPSTLRTADDPSAGSLWSALTAVAVTGLRLRGRPAAQTAGLQALAVIVLLAEAAVRTVGGEAEGSPMPEEVRRSLGAALDEEDEESSLQQLIARVLIPLLSPLPRRAEVTEALLFVLFLLWCGRASAIGHFLCPGWSCPTALSYLPCQAVCDEALSSCEGEAECGHLLPVLLHVAAYASLKSRAWLWQRLSDVACQEKGGAPALLQATWSSWPSLVLASMRGVRRPQCSCRCTKHSQRVWRFVSQVVDALLLALLLYWPASAFALHWEGLRRAVEWEWDQGASHCHLVLQHLMACTLRRAQLHPRLQPLLKPKPTSSPSPLTPRQSDAEKGEGERLLAVEKAAQARLQGALEVLFYKVLSFVVTAGSRFPPSSPASSRHRLSLSSPHHVHSYWLHRSREAQAEMKSPSRSLSTSAVLQGGRPPMSRPTSRPVSQPASPASLPRPHRRSQSEVFPSFPSLRVDDELARTEQRTAGQRSGEAVDLHSLLESLVKQRAALRLRWHCRRGEDQGVVAWQMADAPLLAQLQATFASHPSLHPISDLWAKVVPDLEQLRWNRRGLTDFEWREVEERHVCQLLLASTAEQRRQADNAVQTEIRGLAGKRLPDWFGDMPRLNLPRAGSTPTQGQRSPGPMLT